MRKAAARILVVTGPSGGHIYPALSLLEQLKKSGSAPELLLVVPKKSPVQASGYPLKRISAGNISFSFDAKGVSSLYNLIKGAFESLMLVLKFRPCVAVGFGSIDSLPVMFLSWMFRMKTIIHEQNVVPGMANLLLAKFVDKIAVSFEDTRRHLHVDEQKVVFTGNPIRQTLVPVDKNMAIEYFALDRDRFTILVMGGSQGSHSINTWFIKGLAQVKDKSRMQVIHLCGGQQKLQIKAQYDRLNIRACVFDFLAEMHYAYSASDLALCRSGATTVAELTFFRVPSILIPYPYARRHQLHNAMVLQQKGCAVIINEEELKAGAGFEKIEEFLRDPGQLSNMRSAYPAQCAATASEALAREVTALLA